MTIERGTTQLITITIKGWDLTGCDIYVTFKQGNNALTKTTMDSVVYANNETKLKLTLSQGDTLRFADNSDGQLQVRWIDSNGSALKTKVATFRTDEALYDKAIEWESEP